MPSTERMKAMLIASPILLAFVLLKIIKDNIEEPALTPKPHSPAK